MTMAEARNNLPQPWLGIGTHSYGFHWSAGRSGQPGAKFGDPLTFLAYARELGAAGVQMAIGRREAVYTEKLRQQAMDGAVFIEAQGSLPGSAADLTAFEAELVSASAAGATIYRTAMLGGRRYEQLKSAADWREFQQRAVQRIQLGLPLLRKHGLKLAIENHKDYRVPELIELVAHFGGLAAGIGVTLDTGNSLALLEDAHRVVEQLAPITLTVHLKDMGWRPCDDGFLLSEVPLGEGFLDLRRMIGAIRRAAPQAQFNLEMITRDPLRIPCLSESYWATLPETPARVLAQTLGLVQAHAAVKPLPRVTGLDSAQKLKLEDDHVRASLKWAASFAG